MVQAFPSVGFRDVRFKTIPLYDSVTIISKGQRFWFNKRRVVEVEKKSTIYLLNKSTFDLIIILDQMIVAPFIIPPTRSFFVMITRHTRLHFFAWWKPRFRLSIPQTVKSLQVIPVNKIPVIKIIYTVLYLSKADATGAKNFKI